jgi:D-arabinose 1-dehydrogenase-like Zn-dependent alcohol dehydrogenase
MPSMRAIQVSKAGAPLELVERPIPEPRAGAVRVKVDACGVCHSDAYVKEGLFPGLKLPRIPGHEIVGVVDAVGPGVTGWSVGQKVGVGWNGGSCGVCDPCRRGNFFACRTTTPVTGPITGITHDGGFADYTIAAASALARLPDGIDPVEAAPLLCAGLTTFNALRNSPARAGDLVAVLGLGGLGHLGVQFAAKMGFKTVAIARGKDKEPLAKKLGAWRYLDSEASDPAAELGKLGGARVILATVTNGDAMSAVMGGLGPNGSFIIAGAPQTMTISPGLLIAGRRSIDGWYSGVSIDSEDTLDFSVLTGVRAMNEVYPLEKANEAYERMMSGKARFRVVLTTKGK